MPKGFIYYAEIVFSYQSGTSKRPKRTTFRLSCVGYNPDDAFERMKQNTSKIVERTKKKLGKIRAVEVHEFEVITRQGLTTYDIDTGKAIKSNQSNT